MGQQDPTDRHTNVDENHNRPVIPGAAPQTHRCGFSRMADGIDAIGRDLDLPCRAFRLGPRSGVCLTPGFPRNYREARLSMDLDMLDARRAFMANRGYWDCIVSAGPQASF